VDFGEFLKFVHVVAAVVWVGGPVVIHIMGNRALRQGGSAVAEFARISEITGMVFGAAAAVVLGFGIWIVAERDYVGFSDAWVTVSLVLTIVLFLAGPLFFAPQSKALTAEASTRGGDDPAVVGRARRISLVARLDSLTALFVVFLMVAKPWS
jgi:uncharacterized membrane protein